MTPFKKKKDPFDDEFCQKLFIEGDWSLEIMTYDYTRSEVSSTCLKSISTVFVGMLLQARLTFIVSRIAEWDQSLDSAHHWAENVLKYVLPRVNVHLETSFIKKATSSTVLDTLKDLVIPFPDSVYKNVSYTIDKPSLSTTWVWEPFHEDQISNVNSRSDEDKRLHAQTSSEISLSDDLKLDDSSRIFRFIRCIPVFIDTPRRSIDFYDLNMTASISFQSISDFKNIEQTVKPRLNFRSNKPWRILRDQLNYIPFEELISNTMPPKKNLHIVKPLEVAIGVQLHFKWAEHQIGERAMGILSAILRSARNIDKANDHHHHSADKAIWQIQSAQLYAHWNLSLMESSRKNDFVSLANLENDFLQEVYIEKEFCSQEGDSKVLCYLGFEHHEVQTLNFRIYFPSRDRITSVLQAIAPSKCPLEFRFVVSFLGPDLLESSSHSFCEFEYAYEIPIDIESLVNSKVPSVI